MTAKNLTIKLTNEQQKQIREATGKNVAELNIGLAEKGHLTEKELEQVAGGDSGGIAPGPFINKGPIKA